MNNTNNAIPLTLTKKQIYSHITVLIISTLAFIISYPHTTTFLNNAFDSHSYIINGLNYLGIFLTISSAMIAVHITCTLVIHLCSLAVQYLSNVILPKILTGLENATCKVHNAAVKIICRRK